MVDERQPQQHTLGNTSKEICPPMENVRSMSANSRRSTSTIVFRTLWILSYASNSSRSAWLQFRPDNPMHCSLNVETKRHLVKRRTDGGHVQHARAKLDECPAFDGNVQISNVVQDKVNETLQLRLCEVGFQALRCHKPNGTVDSAKRNHLQKCQTHTVTPIGVAI
jgi:hypothetical protein